MWSLSLSTVVTAVLIALVYSVAMAAAVAWAVVEAVLVAVVFVFIHGIGCRRMLGGRKTFQWFGVVRPGGSELGCRHCTAQKNVGD